MKQVPNELMWAILNVTHRGHSYSSVARTLEKLRDELGDNAIILADALREYYKEVEADGKDS